MESDPHVHNFKENLPHQQNIRTPGDGSFDVLARGKIDLSGIGVWVDECWEGECAQLDGVAGSLVVTCVAHTLAVHSGHSEMVKTRFVQGRTDATFARVTSQKINVWTVGIVYGYDDFFNLVPTQI